MLSREFRDGNIFEREVRNIARELWPGAEYSGSVIVDDKERDGIFELEDAIHCIECTVSREEQKARQDVEKLNELVENLRRKHPSKAVKGWFVTLHEPTPEQGRHIKRRLGPVNHVTYDAFRAKLISASEYINLRSRHHFGSARNISDDSIDIPPNEYVEVDLFPDDGSKPRNVAWVARTFIEQNPRIVLQGEYGVGKSMALRQLFLQLARAYSKGHDLRFPLYINLRDHREITDPADALRQHARLIGYSGEHHLVRAFRAGYVHLILDGFDELPPRFGARDPHKARDIRRAALELVRRFFREAPQRVPIIIAGRNNFFDNQEELKEALGLTDKFEFYSLTDFSELQITEYLKKKGGEVNALPSWLPRKPLLVGYFITRNLQSLLTKGTAEENAGKGWSSLLDMICDREASQLEIGIFGRELRQLYARLATKARKKSGRVGPVLFNEAKDAFREIFDFDPEDRALTALLRLPGLVAAGEDGDSSDRISLRGARWFVDENFMDAAAAPDILLLVKDPLRENLHVFSGIRRQLTSVGIPVSAHLYEEEKLVEQQILNAMARVASTSPDALVAVDLLHLLKEVGTQGPRSLTLLENQLIDDLFLDFEGMSFRNVHFKDSYFRRVRIDCDNVSALPYFDSCYVGVLQTSNSLPDVQGRFNASCEIESMQRLDRDNLNGDGDLRLGVLKNVLSKLFVQSLSGRQQRAFSRGMPPAAMSYVQDVLYLVKKHGFAFRRTNAGNPVWYPVKSRLGDAHRILEAPDSTKDSLVREVLELDRVTV